MTIESEPSLVILAIYGLAKGLGSTCCTRYAWTWMYPSSSPAIAATRSIASSGLSSAPTIFVTKPFGLCELLARIRAVIRRREIAHAATQRETGRGRLRFAGWELDRRLRRLTDPVGTVVALTTGEYALLLAFLDAPRRPLTREHLLQATRKYEDVSDRSIDLQVLRLRRKLESNPSAPQFILTERGVGYVFAMCVEIV
jgi:DNA-binding response OmpR family regulator